MRAWNAFKVSIVSLLVFLAGCSQVPHKADVESASAHFKPKSHAVLHNTTHRSLFPFINTRYQHTNDLWERVRAHFQIEIDEENPRVQHYITRYSENPEVVRRLTAKAEPYIFHIVEELEKRNLPAELSLLPFIESAYEPYALSRVGAAGLWQIMPATATHLKVPRSRDYDGRRDLHDATNGALDYLSFLNTTFNDDWLLSLAAYNSGEGTVTRSIQKNRLHGKATDYWSLRLPDETQHYVPRFLALCAIISDPERYHVELHPIHNKPYITTVKLHKKITLVEAAELAEMPFDNVKRLNAGVSSHPLNTHVTKVNLPTSKASIFEDRLAAYVPKPLPPMVVAKSHPKSKPIIAATKSTPQKFHVVRRGESLWAISKLYGVTVESIKALNRLSHREIKAGDKLLILAKRT